jgi:hypothetical protein
MEKKKFVGFRLSYMEGDPRYAGVAEPAVEQQSVPDGLAALRKKIAGMVLFMSSTKFARMGKSAKLEFIMDFAELNSIESGYASAVESAGAGVTDNTVAGIQTGDE